tara:strand:+ start:514 stop:690 length:177 start_codon:yes stop_codon:yes gene_type:complete
MRDKVLKAVMLRYGSLATLDLAMWEDEDTVVVNLSDDLNEDFEYEDILIIIKDLLNYE